MEDYCYAWYGPGEKVRKVSSDAVMWNWGDNDRILYYGAVYTQNLKDMKECIYEYYQEFLKWAIEGNNGFLSISLDGRLQDYRFKPFWGSREIPIPRHDPEFLEYVIKIYGESQSYRLLTSDNLSYVGYV